ncbi:hypothetical protein [Aminobacter sp. MDW-2]|nr:hypothetical protein [Aminobacter sp. MDW-2]
MSNSDVRPKSRRWPKRVSLAVLALLIVVVLPLGVILYPVFKS